MANQNCRKLGYFIRNWSEATPYSIFNLIDIREHVYSDFNVFCFHLQFVIMFYAVTSEDQGLPEYVQNKKKKKCR